MDLKLNFASFANSPEKIKEDHVYDVIVIGGGPAALNAALYAARKKLDTAIVTSDIGGQIAQSSSIENWLGTAYSDATTLVNRFYEHVSEYGLIFKKNTLVTEIETHDPIKKIITNNGTFQAKTIIIATGKSPRKLGIPGEDEFVGRGLAYCTTCDGPAFQDKKVVVVGGGNSGVEAALDLLSYASEVHLVQNLDKLTADTVLIDKLTADPRVRITYNSVCVRVEGNSNLEKLVVRDTKTNQEFDIVTDGVFVEVGLEPTSQFVPDTIKNKNGEIIINSLCETNITGIYAAGDVTNVPYKQVIIAAGEGAKAALSVHHYIINK